jgi:uncharacterized membrane protein YqgA involved in biofilm formation
MGHALFKSMKSIYMRQSSLDFFTKTVFESHLGHLTSQIKFALSNFATSSCTTFVFQDPYFFSFVAPAWHLK